MALVFKENQNGTVSCREKRWYRIPETGERVQLQMPYVNGRNKLAARQEAQRWADDGGWERLKARHKQTNGDYLLAWFDRKEREDWAPTTAQTNRFNFKKHVTTAKKFLDIPLGELSQQDAIAFMHAVKGSDNTKHNIRRLLTTAYEDALSEAIPKIKINPFKKLPKRVKGKKAVANVLSLTADEEARLIEAVQPNPFWKAAVYLALDAALSPCELLALRLENLEPRERRIRIEQDLVDVRGAKPVLGPLKADSRRRQPQVSQDTWDALQGLLGVENATSDGFIFHRDGQLLGSRTTFRKAWLSFLRASGLPKLNFYQLRHSCAMNMARSGKMNLAAMKGRLGHAKHSTTIMHYLDAVQAEADAAADVFASRRRVQV